LELLSLKVPVKAFWPQHLVGLLETGGSNVQQQFLSFQGTDPV